MSAETLIPGIPDWLLERVSVEISHAERKHRDGIEASKDAFLRILVEEVGEVAKSINKQEPLEKMTDEVAQVIAVCVMWEKGTLKDSTL